MDHLFRLYQLDEWILSTGYINYNPIEIRLFSLLEEQRQKSASFLNILQKESDPSVWQYYLSVIYRDDETAQPTFQEWKRTSIWMESAPVHLINHREELISAIRHELKQMVPIVQSIYGNQKAKFIIPALIRS